MHVYMFPACKKPLLQHCNKAVVLASNVDSFLGKLELNAC